MVKKYFLSCLLVMLLLSLVACSQIQKMKSEVTSPVASKKISLHSAWSKNHDPVYDSGNLPINLSSPLIHAGVLYVGSGKGEMIAYDARTGRVLWKDVDKGAYHATPIIYKDQVVYGSNLGRLYSRHYLTGKIKYAVDLGASIESEVVIHNQMAVVHLRNYQITCFDIETGKILWAYKRSVPHLTTLQRSSKPLIWNNKIYVGFADGFLVNLSLEDGMLQWEKKLSSGTKFVDVDNTPVIIDHNLYINSLAGPVYLLEAQTGAIIRQGEFTPSRSPLSLDSKLLFGTVDGEIIQTDKNLTILKKINLESGGVSSIKRWKDYLVATTNRGFIFLMDPQTYQVLYKKHLGHANSSILGEIEVADDLMAAYSSRYRLYVYR